MLCYSSRSSGGGSSRSGRHAYACALPRTSSTASGCRVEEEYAPLYAKHGLGLTTWSPLASGVLTGEVMLAPQSWRTVVRQPGTAVVRLLPFGGPLLARSCRNCCARSGWWVWRTACHQLDPFACRQVLWRPHP